MVIRITERCDNNMYKLLLSNTDHLQQFEDYVDCDIADISVCITGIFQFYRYFVYFPFDV